MSQEAVKRSNAVQIDLNIVRNALAKTSQEGDYLRAAQVAGVQKDMVWKYMNGRRSIDTPAGINILNAFAEVVEQRAKKAERARLLAAAAAL